MDFTFIVWLLYITLSSPFTLGHLINVLHWTNDKSTTGKVICKKVLSKWQRWRLVRIGLEALSTQQSCAPNTEQKASTPKKVQQRQEQKMAILLEEKVKLLQQKYGSSNTVALYKLFV